MRKNRIGRGAFVLAVAGSLGFGAQQALAEPALKRNLGCNKFECIEWCAESQQKGVCMPLGDGWYYCECQ